MDDIRDQLLAAFDVEHQEHLEAIRRALAQPDKADLREIFRRAHSLKGAARAVDLPKVETLAHGLEELFAQLMDGKAALDAAAVDRIHLSLDAIEAETSAVLGGAVEQVAAPAEPHDDDRTLEFLRVETAAVGDLVQAMHQLGGDLQAPRAASGALRKLQADARRLERLWAELAPPAGGGAAAAASRDFGRALKSLGRELGDLALRQGRAAWALDRSAERVRGQVEAIALTPASAVFGDLGRMVRDLGREQGVELDARIDGLETRAERRVLQRLRDPLVHILRNAVSHGAEPAEVRAAAGKPPRLQVGLEIASRGGRLQLRVYDDGAGPDLARIEAAAVARGALPRRAAGDPPPLPEEILAAAFQPGVSAAEGVDRLAGRGMGLSVALEAVRLLGGSARLAARRPAGAEVILAAPLSTARQTLVMVEADGDLYALPSFGVQRLLRLRLDDLEYVEGVPTVRIAVSGAEVVTPVVSLAALLGRPAAEPPSVGGYVTAVLLARGDRRLALAVEALRDVAEAVVETAPALGVDAGVALGAVLVEEDLPATVLNPDALIERWLRDARRLAAAGLGLAPALEAPQARTVLVVDDSITTRTLEKSILEAQGYRVVLAVDGLDGLNLLRSGEAVVDLVVADIEMPRMDGFSLLQAIKADASLAGLPVILMTSREDPADIRRGMELGAEAYITKQKFDQRELLATIGRVL